MNDFDVRELAFKPVFVRSPYNYDRDAVSDETGLRCEDASLTKQSFKDEADINFIVRQFGLTGQLPDNVRIPEYRDYDTVMDYHSAMNAVRDANVSFMQLPGELRARFHNDPQAFLAFCSDPSNGPEAVKLGLAIARPSVEPTGSAPPIVPAPPSKAE